MGAYWIVEYVKIVGGYIFLMFIWPSVVFGNYLKKKSKKYHFSFCVTVQIIVINTTVLMLGLLGILNSRLIAIVFYGAFLVAVLRKQFVWTLLTGNCEKKIYCFQNMRTDVYKRLHNFVFGIYRKSGEYILLFLVILFGMIYFSWGAFQVHSYGVYDVFLHHGWVNRMIEGEIFPNGIYPQGMHCFIYCLNALFGIRVYSIMMYLQCIHLLAFFLSAYILLREILHWRYSPVFVLCLYVTIFIAGSHSMYRLPLTLPMEFGLHTQFLCAAYLVRYIKDSGHAIEKRVILKCCWDENLFLFMMALAASIASHYYTTIMAFIICASFAIFYIKKILRFQYLASLSVSVCCGCMIAIIPMIGGLAKGIPVEGSIGWALSVIDNNEHNEKKVESVIENEEVIQGPLELTQEDLEVISNFPDIGEKLVRRIIQMEYFIRAMYQRGYPGMHRQERGIRIFWITIIMAVFCIVNKRKAFKYIGEIGNDYLPVILVSIISVFFCMSCQVPDLGFPIIIPEHRFCPEGFLMTFAVMMMPADILFSTASHFSPKYILQILSYLFCIFIYALMRLQGNFHGYLFCSLNRYNAAVDVTNSIIEEFPVNSYTIVSPMEESHQVALYGKHEEIVAFLEKCEDTNYTLSTDYIFIYIEKKPIEYHQVYYYNGPKWLGTSRNSVIIAKEISKEDSERDLSEYTNSIWDPYEDGRVILESKAYEWCRQFSNRHPSELKIYYEDDDFVCYYFKQDIDMPYNLAGE